MNTVTGEASPETLRAQMVDRILAGQRLARSVEDALRGVERHRYVPDAPLADAYAEKAVVTHTFPDGTHLSCASGPTIVAAMLNALDVQPGQRILEIGAGTGYNAALLATLTGPEGHVTTLDIDADVTANAHRNLDATGHGDIAVITRDGALGAPENGPYDRIVVTVGAWDIPPAWRDQLIPGGRLVLPLRWRGTTRAVAFIKREDHLESDWVFLCGFVPMLGQPGEHQTTIDPDGLVSLHHDIDQNINAEALQGVLQRAKTAVWADATVAAEESFDRVWVHLSASDDRTIRIAAEQKAVTTGLCTPAIATRSPAVAEGESLAYFTIRRSETPGRWQLGAIGHGPLGQQLAARIVEQINAWDQNRTVDPELFAYPPEAAVPAMSGKIKIITKPDTHLVLRYPPAAGCSS